MSAVEQAREEGASESVAGFLATLGIFGGLIAIVERPVTIGVFALFIALVASALASGRHRGLAALAVGVAATSWFAGMVVSILADRPLW